MSVRTFYKTEKCIHCGLKATEWVGCVGAYRRMALGNLVPVNIAAGCCKDCEPMHISNVNDGFRGDYKESYGVSSKDLFDRPIGEIDKLFYKSNENKYLGANAV